MTVFQPRQVEPRAPWRWVREAWGLIARRPMAFGLASTVMFALFCAALQVEPPALRFAVALLLPPLGLGTFIRLAQAADRSQPLPLAALLPGNREVLQALGVAVVGYGLAFAVIAAMQAGGEAAGLALEPGQLADQRWRDYVAAVASELGLPLVVVARGVLFGCSLAAFSGLLLLLFAWFALPLSQLGSVRTWLALQLSVSAYRLNAHRIGLASVGALGLMALAVLLTLGLAAMLAAPFLGAMLYVSYREVFLGQAENSPLQIASGLRTADAVA